MPPTIYHLPFKQLSRPAADGRGDRRQLRGGGGAAQLPARPGIDGHAGPPGRARDRQARSLASGADRRADPARRRGLIEFPDGPRRPARARLLHFALDRKSVV